MAENTKRYSKKNIGAWNGDHEQTLYRSLFDSLSFVVFAK